MQPLTNPLATTDAAAMDITPPPLQPTPTGRFTAYCTTNPLVPSNQDEFTTLATEAGITWVSNEPYTVATYLLRLAIDLHQQASQDAERAAVAEATLVQLTSERDQARASVDAALKLAASQAPATLSAPVEFSNRINFNDITKTLPKCNGSDPEEVDSFFTTFEAYTTGTNVLNNVHHALVCLLTRAEGTLREHIQAMVVRGDPSELRDWATTKASILEFFGAKDLAPRARDRIHALKCRSPSDWHAYSAQVQALAERAKLIMREYEVILAIKKPGTLPTKMHNCVLGLAADEYSLTAFIKRAGKLFQEAQIAITPVQEDVTADPDAMDIGAIRGDGVCNSAEMARDKSLAVGPDGRVRTSFLEYRKRNGLCGACGWKPPTHARDCPLTATAARRWGKA